MDIEEINKAGIVYLEHGTREQKDAFWPHDCEGCMYAEEDGCRLGVERFSGLSLSSYLELRLKEGG